jgi:hypothetical protein
MDEGTTVKSETPAFARGMTGPTGKYTEAVKTHLDETAFVDLLRLCHSRNTTPGELTRAALYVVLYGQTPEQIIAAAQSELLAPLAQRAGEVR